jgi:multiple RNA-binding domain-containing protein 1
MAIVKELTGSKRKNKLLAQNPDLERAQDAPLPSSKPVEAPKPEEKSKKRKADEVDIEVPRKRVQVVEAPNVVEVVYDDSAPQNVESEKEDVVKETPATDLDWLRARTSRTLGLDSDNEESDNEKDAKSKDDFSITGEDPAPEPVSNENPPATPPATESSSDDEDAVIPSKSATAESKILATGRLFVRNLVYGVTEEDLRTIFSPYGEIEEVSTPHIPQET